MTHLAGKRPELVAIGISTGGPNALQFLLAELPENLNLPVVIVQHMPPGFTGALASRLDESCALHVKEAQDLEPLMPNVVYLAPGGRQMKVERIDDSIVLRITDDPAENHCKPSVDYLFRSVAESFPARAIGIIMTGMGNDGALGTRTLRQTGCITIAQDMGSCVVFGMPKEAIQLGAIDIIVPLNKIAEEICKRVFQ